MAARCRDRLGCLQPRFFPDYDTFEHVGPQVDAVALVEGLESGSGGGG